MPAKSKAQFRFMEAVVHNKGKMKNPPKGLSPAKAREFVQGIGYKNLPEKAQKK